MKTYKAKRKGLIHYLIALCLLLPFLIFFIEIEPIFIKLILMLISMIPLIITLWTYFDTSYSIENNKLFYRSGFLKGEIDIDKIREIIKGKTLWSGVRPALAEKGIILKYNRYETIYLAPENNDELVADVVKLNNKIKLSEYSN